VKGQLNEANLCRISFDNWGHPTVSCPGDDPKADEKVKEIIAHCKKNDLWQTHGPGWFIVYRIGIGQNKQYLDY